jgi:acetyl esterase/lipase
MFMYMAGMDDEDAFDAMARAMTVRGHLGRVTCPTLLVTGEFDPLCPLEDAVEAYEELKVAKELWVLENQFHPLWKLANLGSLDCHEYVLDWLGTALGGGIPAGHRRIAYARVGGDGPFGTCEWTPPVGPGQAYF